MRPHLAPDERAACPESGDAQGEQACVLGLLERRADSDPPGSAPSHRPAGEPALLSYDVLHSCMHRPGVRLGSVAQCVEEENEAADYLRGALGRLPPSARARCVGAVSTADRRVLEAAAGYFQALTVYYGTILAKTPSG